MAEKQRTVKNAVSFEGIGLHTGEASKITFCPAPADYGYRFIRTDLPEQVEIPALVDYVVDLSRGTTLGIGDVRVHTVEHVLAALAGLRIDNCRIELSGIEPPVGDGSSMPYVNVLTEAGFEELEAEREYFVIDETVRFANPEKGVEIVALPTDDYRITVLIDYNNPALGSQHTGLFNLETEFTSEFASARTFCFLTEVEYLRKQGLIKGGNLDTAIVIVDKDVEDGELEDMGKVFDMKQTPILGTNGRLNNAELRYPNEPARHKLLDMIGDLALAGVSIKAQILAARPGHASNFEFAKKIRALYLKKKPLQKYQKTKVGDAVLGINDLMKILPHRYPFLLIDRVVELDFEENRIVGIKNITANEPQFTGHFPENPIMPGVLILEALAQTGCLLMLQGIEDVSKKLALFQSIKNVKFRRPVVPGDQMVMEMKLINKKMNIYAFKGTASVNGQVAAEAEVQAALIDR